MWKERLKKLAGFLSFIIGLGICWSISYGFVYWFCQHVSAADNMFVRQMITFFLGILLFWGSIMLVIHMKWGRKHQERYLNPMLHAMEMIAEGNFNIDLSFYEKRFNDNDHPYTQIVKNIRHMANSLGQMEDMRQDFISNVSHEIQSPLTSISGFAHAVRYGELTKQEQDHYLAIIETETMRLSKLSENLLKLTSLSSDDVSLQKSSYRLDKQLRRVVLASEMQWVNKNIEMDIALDKTLVTADEDLMEQVWTNLLHNSIKFTLKEGKISINIKQGYDKQMGVEIRDNGIGMEEETRLHIFERFYKADQARTREHGGNGLGLAIVKKIVDLHGGSIHVKSEPNQGTTFIVTI